MHYFRFKISLHWLFPRDGPRILAIGKFSETFCAIFRARCNVYTYPLQITIFRNINDDYSSNAKYISQSVQIRYIWRIAIFFSMKMIFLDLEGVRSIVQTNFDTRRRKPSENWVMWKRTKFVLFVKQIEMRSGKRETRNESRFRSSFWGMSHDSGP